MKLNVDTFAYEELREFEDKLRKFKEYKSQGMELCESDIREFEDKLRDMRNHMNRRVSGTARVSGIGGDS